MINIYSTLVVIKVYTPTAINRRRGAIVSSEFGYVPARNVKVLAVPTESITNERKIGPDDDDYSTALWYRCIRDEEIGA